MTDLSGDSVCPNCGAAAQAAYCAQCGQRLDVDPRSIRQWIADLAEDTLSIDGRVARTIVALLFKPGHLTAEWRQGRRVRWMHPFRLYLFSSLLLFTVLALAPPDPGTLAFDQAVSTDVDREAGFAASADQARQQASMALFFALPIFAGLLKLLFWGAKWHYTDHLVNALHIHSFAFLMLGITAVFEPLPNELDWFLQLPFLLWMVGYTLLALRRAYDTRTFGLLVRAPVAVLVYPLVVGIGVMVVGDLAGGSEKELRDANLAYWELRTDWDQGLIEPDRRRALAEALLVNYRRTEIRLVTPHVRLHMVDLFMMLQQSVAALNEAQLAVTELPDDPLALGMLGLAADAAGEQAIAEDARSRFLDAYAADPGEYGSGSRHTIDMERIRRWAEDRS